MIIATISGDRIVIDGHANYAARGFDIVCAGVSSLVGAVLATLDSNELYYDSAQSDGHVEIEFYDIYMNSPSLYIKDVLYLGLANIQQQYPDHLKMVVET